AFLGLAPTFSTMPTPSAPSSDIWNHGSLAALRGLPSSGGILGQWTQLIGPPTSQTVWNSPTVRTRFLQPVSATTAQLNSNSYQSSVPAPRPSRLARMLDLPPHQWSRLIGLQPIKHPTKWVARPFSRQRPPGFRSLDPTAGTIPNPPRRPHQRTFGRDCVKPSPIRIFAITRVRDSRNLSTSWPPSCRFCLVPAPRNQCKTARGREKTSRPETTAMRHFISARASSTPASIGCLRENNWRFWVGWPPRLFRGRSLRLQRPWRRPVNRLMKFGVRPVLSVAQTIFAG